MTRDELLRQKFILDILRQVELPLQDRVLLEMDVQDVTNENIYTGPLDDDMRMVLDLMRSNRMLGRNDMCSMTNELHLRQLLGLYRLLVRVSDFHMLQRVAVYARRNINPVLFVNALTLALQDRSDTEMLIVPAIYEILPRNYLDDTVIRSVEQIARDTTGVVNRNVASKRPSLLDLIDMRRNANLNLNPVVGLGIVDKSQLWMPWRDLHQQLAMQKTMGGRVVMVDQNSQDMSLRVIPMVTGRGLLAEDVGLRAFLNILIDELVVEQGDTMKNVDRDVLGNDKMRGRNIDQDVWTMGRERNVMDRMDSMRRGNDDDMWRMQRERNIVNRMDTLRRDMDEDRDMNWGTRRDNILRRNQDIQNRRLTDIDDDAELLRMDRDRTTQHMGSTKLNMLNGKVANNRLWNRNIDAVSDVNRMRTMGINRNLGMDDDLRMNRNLGMERNLDRDMGMNRNLGMDRNMGWNMNGNLGMDRGMGMNWNLDMNRDRRMENDIEMDRDIRMNRNLGIDDDLRMNRNLGMDRNMGMNRNLDMDRDVRMNRNLGIDRTMEMNRNMRMDRDDNMMTMTGEKDRWQSIMNRRNLNDDDDDSIDNDRMMHYGGRRLGLLNGKSRNMDLNDVLQGDRTDELRRVPRSINRMMVGVGEIRQRMGQLILHNLQQLVARLNIEQISLQNGVTNMDSLNRLGRVGLMRDTINGDIRGNMQSVNGRGILGTVRNEMSMMNRVTKDSSNIMDVMRGVGRMNRMVNMDINRNLNQGSRGVGRLDNLDLKILEDSRLDERTRDIVRGKMQEITNRLEMTLEQTITHLDQRQQHYNNLGLDDQIIIEEIDRLVLNEILQEIVSLSELVEGGQISNILETPISQVLLRHTINTIERQIQQLRRPRNLNEVVLDGVTVNNVNVGDSRTYMEEVDVDLSNVLDTMSSQKTIIGRVPRLNHKSFAINLDVTSNHNQRVVVRTLLVPKVDVMGRQMTTEEQRQNTLLLDIVNVDLIQGRNVIKRKSRDITWTGRDVTTYSELYERVMRAMQGNVDLTLKPLMGQTTLLPHRLLLPRGRVEGLPMQLLIVITPADDTMPARMMTEGQQVVNTRLGLNSLLLDNLPLTYPMDRNMGDIRELLNLPNIGGQDILIYHEDKVNRLRQ
uniref:Hemocyanin n=1 Tax=Musca domestica TaxID=7370 RepID=T1PG53_MUSDO